MSTLSDKSSSPVVSDEMQCAMRGFSLLKEAYGKDAVTRLKNGLDDLNVMHCHKCPAAIASGKDYDSACCEMDLNNIHDRAHHGFVHRLGDRPSKALTIAWMGLIRAA